jgi:hypothetical protein
MPEGIALASRRPALMVVIDTEEEFDWFGPFDRNAIGVDHLRRIGSVQAVCERWGIRPVYAVDYPVASQRTGIEVLRPLLAEDRALVGTHLHPWVSPPYDEEVNEHNSFPGNLPPALEHAKLERLTECIEATLGARPLMYKAGRYGIGPSTFAILEDLGYLVDLSPSPPFDYRPAGGPDFSRRGLTPAWVGPRGSVLSVPGTGALIGWLPSHQLYQATTSRYLARFHMSNILARCGMAERLRLSPEGLSQAEMVRLVRWLHQRGQRLFVLSLHSPSMAPGNTPYVRSEADRDELLATLDSFFGFFMAELGGVPTDPLAVRAALAR